MVMEETMLLVFPSKSTTLIKVEHLCKHFSMNLQFSALYGYFWKKQQHEQTLSFSLKKKEKNRRVIENHFKLNPLIS